MKQRRPRPNPRTSARSSTRAVGGPPASGELLDQQGAGFGMSDARQAMGEQDRDPDRDAIVSMPESLDLTAAQQMNLEPGDLAVDKHGALQFHFDDSEDLLVTLRRGIQELEQAGEQQGLQPRENGGTGDGGSIRVLLYAPHMGPVQVGTGGGGQAAPSSAMERKVSAFQRRLEEGLQLLDRSGVAPDTLRIFMGTEWFRDEQGRQWSQQEQQLAIQLLSAATSSFMNMLVVPGTLKWAASAMLPDDGGDEPRP